MKRSTYTKLEECRHNWRRFKAAEKIRVDDWENYSCL